MTAIADPAELASPDDDPLTIGRVSISRERISVVEDGTVMTSFAANGVRSLAVVEVSASKHPVREAAWGLAFVLIAVVRVGVATSLGETLAYLAFGAVGLWVLLNILRRATRVRIVHTAGPPTFLDTGVKLSVEERDALARRCASLGYPTA